MLIGAQGECYINIGILVLFCAKTWDKQEYDCILCSYQFEQTRSPICNLTVEQLDNNLKLVLFFEDVEENNY